MSRMGHDSTRAALIYLQGAPGADRAIADALPVEFEEDDEPQKGCAERYRPGGGDDAETG